MSMVMIILAVLALIAPFLLVVTIYIYCDKNPYDLHDPELGLAHSSHQVKIISPSVSRSTVCPQQIAVVKVVDPPPTYNDIPSTSKNPPPASTSSFVGSSLRRWPKAFTREKLEKATDGFSDDKILGVGGFGIVYKGILSDGELVAVKKLKPTSKQGDREFLNEIKTTGGIHHQNLVSLAGYCIDGDERIIVYEFLPNNSLKSHLHETNGSAIEWRKRMEIALGSAKGLEYLHEDCKPRIIHRDIKPENILLDDEFKAKVADFGLAKFFPDFLTHVTTACKGTFGYLDPEYFRTHKLTVQSDVYSFGVVLWELITGRRYIDDTFVTFWAKSRLYKALKSGSFDALADPRLENKYDKVEMRRMICCAAACVYKPQRIRPRIGQIVLALEGVLPWEEMWNCDIDMPPVESSGSSSGQYKDALDTIAETDKKGKCPVENSSS